MLWGLSSMTRPNLKIDRFENLKMISHQDLTSRDLFNQLKNKSIAFVGNRKLKIYGQLNCSSGKRMSKQNRVFFKTEMEAMASGFRPCGHCLHNKYVIWKEKEIL